MGLTEVMPSLPLLFHASLDQTIAWRDGAPVPVREFLFDVKRLAQALPAGAHVFNMCTDRYRFAVGLCAAMVAGKTSLLPSAHTPEAVRQLAAFAPDTFCLHDSATCSVALRSPPRINGIALGTSTRSSTWASVMPIARAASTTTGSTLAMPA